MKALLLATAMMFAAGAIAQEPPAAGTGAPATETAPPAPPAPEAKEKKAPKAAHGKKKHKKEEAPK